jgi:hypothetical protein
VGRRRDPAAVACNIAGVIVLIVAILGGQSGSSL